MDSDIMGIIMALLTFLFPAISALLEKNRKKKKGEAVQDVQDSLAENEEESPFFDLKAIFDEVTEELVEEAVPVTADVPLREVPGSVVPEGEKPKNIKK